jgi:uncharacterized protein YdeI (YjbR/CyaY-like superfamily)
MEGEKELPPILRSAFLRHPLAEEGWKAMTPTQRRNNLFYIFNCTSADAREKRVRAAISAAVTRAGRKAGGPRTRSGRRPDTDVDSM